MSGAIQMRAPERRANENCASSGIPILMQLYSPVDLTGNVNMIEKLVLIGWDQWRI